MSGSFRNFAGLDATRANLHALHAPLRALDANVLQVWIKAAARAVVRMRDIIAELRAFAADFASFSHDYVVTSERKKRKGDPLVTNSRI